MDLEFYGINFITLNENSDTWQAVHVRSPESSKILSQTGVLSKKCISEAI